MDDESCARPVLLQRLRVVTLFSLLWVPAVHSSYFMATVARSAQSVKTLHVIDNRRFTSHPSKLRNLRLFYGYALRLLFRHGLLAVSPESRALRSWASSGEPLIMRLMGTTVRGFLR